MKVFIYVIAFFTVLWILMLVIKRSMQNDKKKIIKYPAEEFIFNEKHHDKIRLSKCNNEDAKCVSLVNKKHTLIKENKPYLFIHIPKNAGTYIRQILPGLNGSNDHMTALSIRTHFPAMFKSSYSFAILRNPWERCVSMYNNHVNTNHMDIKGWGAYGMKILKKHKVESFSDFVDLLHAHKDNISALGEIVWEKQIKFITDEKRRVIVDKLIKIEDIVDELNKIKKYYKITIPDPSKKINVSKTIDYKSYYTSEIKSKVDAIYKDDIELTKYTF